MIILEELLEAQNQSRIFGLRLNLPIHEVDAICARFSDPPERLLHIIIAFLQREELRPTWRVIVGALRSRVVNLTALARRVQAAHCPDLTATRVRQEREFTTIEILSNRNQEMRQRVGLVCVELCV